MQVLKCFLYVCRTYFTPITKSALSPAKKGEGGKTEMKRKVIRNLSGLDKLSSFL